MPQNTGSRYRKRRVRKSRPWYMRKYSPMEIAGKAWSGVKYLKGLVNSELKTLDIDATVAAVDYNGNVKQLSLITQGDTRVSRDGKSILCKSVFIRGQVASSTTPNNNVVRLMIVIDTMNDGTAPTGSDVLETTGSALAPFSALKQTASGRYKVIYSKIFSLSKTSNTSQVFKAYIPVNKHIKYTGANATDTWKNNIYMLTFSTVAAASGNEPALNAYSRVSFYDN